ncbi:MAG: DUF262 domain-containing protein [Helicobacter sp.]|nr:DUF262 domain-containing protein [Helicobacter sp.]
MIPQKENIKTLFERAKPLVPMYERAYQRAWSEAYDRFVTDLCKAAKGSKNPYFLGIIVLYKPSKNAKTTIVYGLQRLTTLVIFVRALLNILQKRAKKERLHSRVENEDFLESIKEAYLISNHQAKLEMAERDKDFFERAIIYNEKPDSKTDSQSDIEDVKESLEVRLNKLGTKELLELVEALQKIELTSVYVEDRTEALVIFEMLHFRGSKLIESDEACMDRFKSYIAYTLYTHCPKEDFERKLDELTNIFKEFRIPTGDRYREAKYHLSEWFMLFHFDMTKSFDIKNGLRTHDFYFSYFIDKQPNENKIEWIELYLKELKEAFSTIEIFLHKEKTPSVYADYLLGLDREEIYPFILKAYRLFGTDSKQLERVFSLLEIFTLRYEIYRDSSYERGDKWSIKWDENKTLSNLLKKFTTAQDLEKGLKSIIKRHLNDKIIAECLTKLDWYSYASNYLLAHYENYLRNGSVRTEKLPFSEDYLGNVEREHIAPEVKKGEKKAAGYCKYNKAFCEQYLNCIGNLILPIPNETYDYEPIDNVPFKNKLANYENSPLAQQREIKDFATNGVWDKQAIEKRHKKIEKFVLETWRIF